MNRTGRRRVGLIVGVVSSAVLVLGGAVAAAMVLPGLFSAENERGDARPAGSPNQFVPANFLGGVGEPWTIEPQDVFDFDSGSFGAKRRDQAAGNLDVSSTPLQIEGAIVVPASDGGGAAGVALLEPADGSVIWKIETTESRADVPPCAVNRSQTLAACAVNEGKDSHVYRFDRTGVVADWNVDGTVRAIAAVEDGVTAVIGDAAVEWDADGKEVWKSELQGDGALTIPNAVPGGTVVLGETQTWVVTRDGAQLLFEESRRSANTWNSGCAAFFTSTKLLVSSGDCNDSLELGEFDSAPLPFDVDVSVGFGEIITGDQPVWLVSGMQETVDPEFSDPLTAAGIDAETGELLWEGHTAFGGYAASLPSGHEAVRGGYWQTNGISTARDVHTGQELFDLPDAESTWYEPVGNAFLALQGDPKSEVTLSAFSIESGSFVGSTWTGSLLNSPGGTFSFVGGPNGAMSFGTDCTSCSETDADGVPVTKLMFVPPALGPGETPVTLASLDVPFDLPACPSDTMLIAWAQSAQGWVLVCGVDLETPSAALWQPTDGEPMTTVNFDDPKSEVARESVTWDREAQIYRISFPGEAQLVINAPGQQLEADGMNLSTSDESMPMIRKIIVPLGDLNVYGASELRNLADGISRGWSFDAAGEFSKDATLNRIGELSGSAMTSTTFAQNPYAPVQFHGAIVVNAQGDTWTGRAVIDSAQGQVTWSETSGKPGQGFGSCAPSFDLMLAYCGEAGANPEITVLSESGLLQSFSTDSAPLRTAGSASGIAALFDDRITMFTEDGDEVWSGALDAPIGKTTGMYAAGNQVLVVGADEFVIANPQGVESFPYVGGKGAAECVPLPTSAGLTLVGNACDTDVRVPGIERVGEARTERAIKNIDFVAAQDPIWLVTLSGGNDDAPTMVALDARNGMRLWSTTGEVLDYNPVRSANGDSIVVSSAGTERLISVRSGIARDVSWTSDGDPATLAAAGNAVVGVFAKPNSGVPPTIDRFTIVDGQSAAGEPLIDVGPFDRVVGVWGGPEGALLESTNCADCRTDIPIHTLVFLGPRSSG